MKMLSKYTKSFRLGLQSAMEYRTDFFVSILGTVFPVIIQVFLWSSIYGGSKVNMMFGFTYNQMIMYTLLAGIITKLVAAGFEEEIAGDIKNGSLSKFIVQPVSYITYRASCFLGYKSFQAGIILLLAFLITAVFGLGTDASVSMFNIAIFPAVIILSILLNFLLFFCLSTFAFWMTDAWSIFFGGKFIIQIASGGIFPLDVFGSDIMRVLDFLPFKYIIYFPVNILSGRLGTGAILQVILVQTVWILILTVSLKLLWKRGMKRYVAVGG